ncbi:rga1 [Candida theae]|uniref:Rga1 n=1 Tax=Candida theae TaxID=1198502 RepID=A0AAD5FXM1_9ASCO|nr:rga1 [Candida theae]KAI5954886.1 rga1 [Candida theae]
MSKVPNDFNPTGSVDRSTPSQRPVELASPMQAVTRNDDMQNYYYTRHPETHQIPNTAPPSDRRSGHSRHSRSHSHNSDHKNPKHRLFHPVSHNAYSQYPAYPMNVSSPKPSSAPPPSPQMRRQQQPSASKSAWQHDHLIRPNDAQPNWSMLITPLNETPREANTNFVNTPPQPKQQQQQQQHNQPVSSNGYHTPEAIRQAPIEGSASRRSNLDPSQRHSIAISPTPEKQVAEEKYLVDNDPPDPPKQQSNVATRTRTKKKSRKICQRCGLEITGQFVRALQSAYHVDCFTCHECGKQCSAKFFPFEVKQNGKSTQVALCEYDYFKKLDLICFSCNNALRGPYITALGNKYHLEHFKCSVCQHVFDSDESYFEHENDIFCHYHYSKLYASHCEGCQSSILKQFVELYRGGRTQHWHPECFMVHKFWNVCITADSVGLQKSYGLPDDKLADLRAIKMSDTSLNSERLVGIEQHIEHVVMNCWLMLSGYEQSTAACISDMLLNACTGNKYNGLIVTGKLILNVEILFRALDLVLSECKIAARMLVKPESPELENSDSSATENEYFQFVKKEPRNITGKIMSYLAILRKSASISKSGTLSAELLSVITGSAHYLKLLIRIGLYNALKLNKLNGTTDASDHFLDLVSRYESVESNKLDTRERLEEFKAKLTVPQSSTDACTACSKSIEKSCVKLGDHRWHWKCFVCARCHRRIDESEVSQTRFNIARQCITCSNCYDGSGITDFEVVSDLSQLVYLLKIALLRSRSVMNIDFDSPTPVTKKDTELLQAPEINHEHDDYTKTLDDVTSLRSKRQSQKLSQSVKKKARKSVIITAPEADKAREDDVDKAKVGENILSENLGDLAIEAQQPQFGRKSSSGSQLSFEGKEELSVKRQLQIRDEPQRQMTATHLDRTSDLLKNEKSLTLDDIPRIVAAEQARDQRPNAFKHQSKSYQRTGSHKLKGSGHSPIQTTPSSALDHILNTTVPGSGPQKTTKQKFYSELTKREHFVMRHVAIVHLCQMNHEKYNKDELVALIQSKKPPTFWDKLKFGGGGGGGSSKDKGNAVFGTELSILTKKYGVDSDLGVGPSKLRIPIVIDDVINALKQKDMSVEGIFRLNGNIKKLRELTEQINKSPHKSPDFSVHTAVQLAALMKKWLRELPTPLLTFNYYDLWISSQLEQIPDRKTKILQLTYCLLPRDHRNLLEVLLYFFSWVASFSEVDKDTGSKMDAHNLATVLAPNILISKQSQGQQEQTGDSYFLAIEVVNQLIEQHEDLSIIPPELMKVFSACGFDGVEKDLSSKEILNQIEAVLKENSAN